MYAFRTKPEFAMKSLKYKLPHSISDTPAIVEDKIYTLSEQHH